MLDFVIFSLVWILAIYGLIEIFRTIKYSILNKNLNTNGIYVIVAVKNQEQKIEGFLRSFLFKYIYYRDDEVNDLIVSDMGSTDETTKIIEKMRKDYNSIKILNWNECKELIEKINKNT